jgi:hypothetical protein
MELHPPVSSSDDDIYQLEKLEGEATALPSKPARGGNFDADVALAPAAVGQSVPTMVAAPVVIGLLSADQAGTISSRVSTATGADTVPGGETVESGIASAPGSSTSPAEATTTVADAGSSPALAPAPAPAPTPASAPGPRVTKLRPKQRRGRVRLRHVMQAWSVSLVVHVVVLSALAAATFSTDTIKKIVNFDSALVANRGGEPELLPIYADPDNIPRDQAIGDEHASTPGEPAQAAVVGDGGGADGEDGGGVIVASGMASGRSSTTPRVRGVGKGRINEGSSLPGIKIEGLGGLRWRCSPLLPPPT